jgi:D-alanyl-D-alanine carboxypeptidase
VTLLLVEEGKLSLDDYLADHLDWPHGETITLRMLLNHTSGIPDYFSLIYANGDRETIKFFKGQWTQGQLVERVRDLDLSFAPGTEQRYCNTNALLIGMVIEKVTGQNLAEVLQEKICIPLELYHTYLYGSVTLEQKPVPGYQGEQRWGKPVARGLVDCSYADHSLLDVGDGSIVSTAADLLTYHNALRTGGLLSDESWLQMKTQTPGFYNGLGYLLSNSKHGITEGNAGRTIGHQSAGYYHEDTDCYFVMLSNRGDGATPLGKALEKLMPKLAKEKMP